ncbi:MAG: cytochrome c3 family protein [Geobacteraceae bacterium]|nr:cytochrome c3 family protein [Geobacteraceae bacterium]
MVKFICVLLLIATNTFAADVITFKGGVVFDHRGHQTDKAGLCSACHEGVPGKIAGFGKEWAHKNCIDCHDIFEKGPATCDGCHPKK